MSKTPTRAYGGVAAEQRAEERKARLLAAALELFARQGYARTTIEALCSEAKVTARHFYQLFDSREAILRALYDNIIADLRAGVLKAMSAPKLNLSEQIPLAVSAMVHHYLEDSRHARVGVLEVVGVSPQMEARRREYAEKGVTPPARGQGGIFYAGPAFEATDLADDELLDGDTARQAISQLREYAKNPD